MKPKIVGMERSQTFQPRRGGKMKMSDQYLKIVEWSGKEYSGKFVVRVGKELHKTLAVEFGSARSYTKPWPSKPFAMAKA